MRSIKLAAGLAALSALAGCAPADEVAVTLRFGSGGKLDGAREITTLATGCPVPMWLAVRGPGIPRIRIPLQGATVDNILSYGGTLDADLTIPDQVVSLPAGPARMLTIIGRMDISDHSSCAPGAFSYPIHGELGPVDIGADPAGTTLQLDVRLSNRRFDATTSGGLLTPSAGTGFQKVGFDLSAFTSDFSACSSGFSKLRVRDHTLDGPFFRMGADGGTSVAATFPGTFEVFPLIPFRVHKIDFVATGCSSAPATRVLELIYKTPRSDAERGTTSASLDHAATCVRVEAYKGVCFRP